MSQERRLEENILGRKVAQNRTSLLSSPSGSAPLLHQARGFITSSSEARRLVRGIQACYLARAGQLQRSRGGELPNDLTFLDSRFVWRRRGPSRTVFKVPRSSTRLFLTVGFCLHGTQCHCSLGISSCRGGGYYPLDRC